MFSVDEYISSIKANLEKESPLVVSNMKRIFTYNFSSDIDLLDFTPSIEPTRFELSITMFSMDKDANEVFNEGNDQTVFAGSEEVLPEVEYYQVNDDQLEAFFDFYEQNEETLVPQEQQVFADWFRQCWETAGGASLDLPSYFVFHDEGTSYDLKNKQWVDDEEKWS
ncbi:hypothetical protein BN1080_01711 [Planococcus massiliensis]|uniref:Uncharacterized protein n=1 Tax=Planococcus massiliensis TaxID=1499687 RepID=A0A098ENA5_9BACL|nr:MULTISPECIES: hypothetical protein [Planococcus]AUD12494.1 hypothetical protein CW734_01090 [Planococcus sp. MB-3u-03]PKG48582.1 hypothetical protein CXF66_00375 [Planococcus sp. Urea-trap-24]PKG90516.1 hypothetical protein CXF91_03650 [Planococcus sp. Urea-3u-39]PKH38134.1 hypothetical protein CXF77_12675 [Planococcus sp. MB-3u-09]CEG22776.1 hypothetical protein BN1080_01711 [Planococcus massiliensis]